MNKLTKAYLRSLPNTILERLRWQYENANPISTLVPAKTLRHRIAMIKKEQGRRWGSVDETA